MSPTNSTHHPRWNHLASRATHRNAEKSAAHERFRNSHKNVHTKSKGTKEEEEEIVPANGIESQKSTGVLYVSERATDLGWEMGAEDWSNLGQGAPETGKLPGGHDRITHIDINELGGDAILEYAPVNGAKALREAVANYYNSFREGKDSKYTYENVAIVGGGRVGLTRVASIVGPVYVSYSVPEYTAYDSMLSSFKKLIPIPSSLKKKDSYKLNLNKLKDEIKEQGLAVIMTSNPKNPTGMVIHSEELKDLVAITKDGGPTLVLDEFYSHYIYDLEEGETVTAARYIGNVEESVIIIDGLTKNHRYPGFRVAWVLGPKSIIKALGQSGGALDGGANHPLQLASVQLFEPKRLAQDRIVLQRHFKMKRDFMLKELNEMGLGLNDAQKPNSTFYIWLDLSVLPSPLNSGIVFFEACLKEKVILVPGIFFDIEPAKRVNLSHSPAHHFVRISYGPQMSELEKGIAGIKRVLAKMEKGVAQGKDLHDLVDQ